MENIAVLFSQEKFFNEHRSFRKSWFGLNGKIPNDRRGIS